LNTLRGLPRKCVAGIVLLVGLSLTVPASPQIALAATNCGSAGHYFDGFSKKGTATYLSWGTSAWITVQGTSICPDASDPSCNGVLAWTMITANDGNGWAQTGFLKWYGGLTHDFMQWTRCRSGCTVHTVELGTHRFAGDQHLYQEKYGSSSQFGCPNSAHCLAMRVDGDTFATTDFDPNGIWSGPWVNQYFGETLYAGSDVPGNVSNMTEYHLMAIQQSSDPNDFVSQPCDMRVRDDFTNRWDFLTHACDTRAIYTFA
jgi:hypothetical protein